MFMDLSLYFALIQLHCLSKDETKPFLAEPDVLLKHVKQLCAVAAGIA